MKDNEIIKAWEKCSNPTNDCYGEDYTCEYSKYDKGTGECFKRLRKDVTDLINRQKAEIERLQGHNGNLLTANTALSNEILDIKSEARKEFAERLKEKIGDLHFQNYGLAILEINELIKEMEREE